MWQWQCSCLLRSNGSHPCNKRSLSFHLGALGRINVCDMPLLYLVLRSRSGVVPQVCPCPVLYISPHQFGIHNHWINMSLNSNDRKAVSNFWAKVAPQADAIGTDALGRWVQPHSVRRWLFLCVFFIFLYYPLALHRLLLSYPQTKIYFSHWKDLSPNSDDVKRHGGLLLNGVTDAVGKINNLTAGLLELSELHAFTLRVDPANFKVWPQ